MGPYAEEAGLRLITETIDEVVWIANYDLSRCLYVSPAYERVWGRSCESLYRDSMSFMVAIHPEDLPRIRRDLQVENRGLPFDHEYRIVRSDGAVRWIWDRGYPVKTPENKVERYVGIAQDITERKHAEFEMASLAERLHLVSRATRDAVWDWDIVGNNTWWSDAQYETLGYDRSVAPGFDAWAARICPEDRSRVMARMKEAMESTSESLVLEYRLAGPDGSTKQILDRAHVIRDQSGKAIRMVGALLDVTEHRRLELQLRQSQKVEAVGQLAGSIAHDFNNILSIIIGQAELVLGDLERDAPSREAIEVIRSAASRGADLTRQLLTFSRQQVLQPRRTDIAGIVLTMTQMLRRLIGEDIDLSIEGAQPAMVLVDPAQITQMILNLAINARDAMPRGGVLTISTSDVVVAEGGDDEHRDLEPGKYVMLSVSDTGVGMDGATQAQMFEPFFTTKGPGQGTGLGLATVRGIVDQSGGKIVTSSELGRGTTFRIYFPQAAGPGQAAGAQAPAAPAKRAGSSGETLLLVEDDHALRAVLRSALLRNGYRVLEAPNGREALLVSEAMNGRIDLVLTDVVMPYMSGRDFADCIVKTRPEVKVLYMSGYTEGVLDKHGVVEAQVAFLQKPVTPAVLVEKVREVLGA